MSRMRKSKSKIEFLQEDQISSKESLSNHEKSRLFLIAFGISYFLFIVIVASLVRNTLPEAQYSNGPQFGALNAMEHLKNITEFQHPWGSEANIKVGQYIVQQLDKFKSAAESNGYFLDIQVNDKQMDYQNKYYFPADRVAAYDPLTRLTLEAKAGFFIEPRNIYARLGQNPSNSSEKKVILVTGHYDSAVMSYGAYDDGHAIVTMLELIRAFIASKSTSEWNYDLLFMFGDGEEIGLIDAEVFRKSPYINKTASFVNMEAGGDGHRVMLFRHSDVQLKYLYSQAVPHPHFDIIGSEAYKLGIIPSDTNFRVLADDSGLPGIDLAFYENRYKYHTHMDAYLDMNPRSMQHNGENVLSYLKVLLRTDYSFDEVKSQEFIIMIDILGQFSVNLSRPGFLSWNVVGIVSFILLYYYSRQKKIVLKNCFKIFGFMILSLLVTLLSAQILSMLNPGIVGVEPLVCLVLTLAISIASHGFIFNQAKQLYLNSDPNLSVLMFYAFMLLASVILTVVGSPILYLFAVWYFALLINYVIDRAILPYSFAYRGMVLFVLKMTIPVMLSWDAFETLYRGLAPSIMDGSPPLLLFLILWLFSMIFLIPVHSELLHFQMSIPTRNVIISGLIIMVVSMLYFPYNTQQAVRLRPQFFQNSSDPTRELNVSVAAGVGLQSVIQNMDASTASEIYCGDAKIYMTRDEHRTLDITYCSIIYPNINLMPKINMSEHRLTIDVAKQNAINGSVNIPRNIYSCSIIAEFNETAQFGVKFEGMDDYLKVNGTTAILNYLRANSKSEASLNYEIEVDRWKSLNLKFNCYVDDIADQTPFVLEFFKMMPNWVTDFTIGQKTTGITLSQIITNNN